MKVIDAHGLVKESKIEEKRERCRG